MGKISIPLKFITRFVLFFLKKNSKNIFCSKKWKFLIVFMFQILSGYIFLFFNFISSYLSQINPILGIKHFSIHDNISGKGKLYTNNTINDNCINLLIIFIIYKRDYISFDMNFYL